MSSIERKKIVYSDNGHDKAIIGEILSEDDYFYYISANGRNYQIGKRAIICIKEAA